MRTALVCVLAITVAPIHGAARAERAKTPLQGLASEIHTTFQPLLWSGRTTRLLVSGEGKVSIEGEGGSALDASARSALRAAGERLHRRYGGRRVFSVVGSGDTLHVHVGSSSRSSRKGVHNLSVEGTGGDPRSVSHVLFSAGGGALRTRGRSADGLGMRVLLGVDGRQWTKQIRSDGAFRVIKQTRSGRSGGEVQVPAPGGGAAIRIRPDGKQVPLSAERARASYRWLGPRRTR